ncbi:AP2-like ethylene-responsive transcription factor At1g16060 [Impatiens glandulifera]|uniref:AP2-like ethylene-responsive transcription factor At1g16060 n=1 Tax=Impatiens glandulifera TaxID=253017 RepID=UPI001FB0D09B|nr:AP2-like ethylene-responsive transcription factor At1g16060 [Impatiens glandulifera]
MTKLSQQRMKNNNNNNNNVSNGGKNLVINGSNNNGIILKAKRTRKTVPRDSPPQRSSIYRGVTRHRWTGRYEAHLWDKHCWNESQNKKGRQGAYDDEDAAARAYDLAALKYWGPETILNFPLLTYETELKEMEGQSREEYIGSLRRKSSGFSRGVSKYRGVARHHHNGRWEARIGRVFGNKYLYLGTYATQEEAAIAYDMAAIEYRGLNAVTNFDLSRYIKWLRPNNNTIQPNPDVIETKNILNSPIKQDPSSITFEPDNHQTLTNTWEVGSSQVKPTTATSALGLLLQSSKFKEMMEMTSITDECPTNTTFSDSSPSSHGPCTFVGDIESCFQIDQDFGTYSQGDDAIFGDLNSFMFDA